MEQARIFLTQGAFRAESETHLLPWDGKCLFCKIKLHTSKHFFRLGIHECPRCGEYYYEQSPEDNKDIN